MTAPARAAIRGRAWCFGDRVTTDDILPGRYLDRSNDEAGKFAMSGIDPDFAGSVSPGDVIVAGQNFGAGSGRENAVAAIRNSGVAAVVAPSFSRLFYRNSINMGMPAVIVDTTAGFENGDPVVVDVEALTVTNERTGEVLEIRNLTGTSREILDAGGIVAFTKRRAEA